MGNSQLITFFAPSKLNLHLSIKDKRKDGYHNLEGIFTALDFGDTLYFEQIDKQNAIEIVMESADGIPLEKNIIFKAVSLFRERTGNNQGLRIRVEKRIPMGGGLGGGSSDAAAALLCLNTDGIMEKNALLELAASIGSDVPFFVHQCAAAYVSGCGEQIMPLQAPCCSFVLVNPGFSSDTTRVYQLFDEKTDKFHVPLQIGNNYKIPKNPQDWKFWNDFLPVFPQEEKSVYNEIISQLIALGAGYAGLSGSGSTCFGAYTDRKRASNAAERLAKSWKFVEFAVPYGKL
jgi:4-diphosphocytidyl-2-C-methyl-D-erythritol kinase